MTYLPEKAWDMHDTEGGGYYFVFETTDSKRYGLRTWDDPEKQPLINNFEKWVDSVTAGIFLEKEAIEIYAEDFRIIWDEDGRICVKGVVYDDAEQPPVE